MGVQYHSIYQQAMALHGESFKLGFSRIQSLTESFNVLITLSMLLLSAKRRFLSRLHLPRRVRNLLRLYLNVFTRRLHFLNIHK